MRFAVLLSGALMTALWLAEPIRAENPEDAKLAAYFRKYLDEEMKHRPSYATALGDHRFDNLLEGLSPAAQKAADERTKKALHGLKAAVDYAKLSRSGQIDFEILEHELKKSLWVSEHERPYETNPLVYNEAITGSVYTMLTQSTTPKERNIRLAAERIAFVPRVIAAAKASLKDPPKIWVEVAIQRNKGAIGFYEKGIFEITGETQGSELHAACRKILPSLHEYQEFLEKDLLPRATGDWRQGKELFAEKLVMELDAGLTAEQVLQDAESEAQRVEREMVVVARQLWSRYFPKQPVPPDDAAGRQELVRKVIAQVSNEHGRVEDLVKDASETVQRVKKFIVEHDIVRLPEPDHCQVIEMPEFQRGFSVAYLNPAPPLDPKASSHYAVSPPPRDWDTRRVESYLQEYNRHMLQILTIHEGYPGHYVQLEYGNRHPSEVRRVLNSGVFAEGWAVYTEQMMLDQGYGDGDLALRLNQLKFYLRAVINALLDHRMHCDNMSDAEAKAQLIVLSHGTLPVKYLPELMRDSFRGKPKSNGEPRP